MAEGDTAVNAAIGAVVSIVLAFIPFSTVVGGAVAGYLQGGETGDGVRVGAIAGAVAALPILFILFLFLLVAPFAPLEFAAVGFFLVAIAIFFVFAYSIGTAAVGGALGIYLRDEL